jgi:hypothetical protein
MIVRTIRLQLRTKRILEAGTHDQNDFSFGPEKRALNQLTWLFSQSIIN